MNDTVEMEMITPKQFEFKKAELIHNLLEIEINNPTNPHFELLELLDNIITEIFKFSRDWEDKRYNSFKDKIKKVYGIDI